MILAASSLASIRSVGLHSIAQLDHDMVAEILSRSVAMKTQTKCLDSLSGIELALMFFEPSTRTRVSFEVAARRLGATVVNFDAGSSSISKGESLRDTVLTVAAFGFSGMVVRSPFAGATAQIATWTSLPVLNAGDGAHQHPSQALLDALSIFESRGSLGVFASLRIGIVGDVVHSRVARSLIDLFSLLGSEVVLIGPRTLLPTLPEGVKLSVDDNLDEHLGDLDVVYLLRVQQERIDQGLIPSYSEYMSRYSLSRERFAHLKRDALIMHAGPVFPGMELDAQVSESSNCLIRQQNRDSVFVRMALLEMIYAPQEML